MEDTQLLSLHLISKNLNSTPSPQSFAECVGQDRLKRYIVELARGARVIGKPFPNALLVGPSGAGKTTFANLISAEVSGLGCRSILASPELSRNDMCNELAERNEGEFLYIDEAHSLNRTAQELLYIYLDSGAIPKPGETRPDASMRMAAPSGPIILSTNHPGALRKELRNRLLVLELDPYTNQHLMELGRRLLGLQRSIDESALAALAEASHGSPRTMISLIKELVLVSRDLNKLSKAEVDALFAHKATGPSGLPNVPHQYIRFLGSQPEYRARLTVISNHFGLDPSFVRNEIESILHRHGYLMVTPHGRVLSLKGRRYYTTHFFGGAS